MKKVKFEWSAKKDKENQAKHGISFELAQYVFADPNRIIAEDLNHSQEEKRYYCFGKIGDGLHIEPGTMPGNNHRPFGFPDQIQGIFNTVFRGGDLR